MDAMSSSGCQHESLDEWIAREAISFSLESTAEFDSAVDRVVAALGNRVELLGLGEPMHGAEEFLVLRNRLFRRLVEAHGYSAVAIESSFPRSRVANKYVGGGRSAGVPMSQEDMWEAGFSHGFGRSAANRELVEWMRAYNSDSSHEVKLRFYGFDSPTEMTVADSPRKLLEFVLDYLSEADRASGEERRGRMEPLWGEDRAWEDPAVAFDPSKGIGLSSEATSLRIETEELITELRVRRPELVSKSDADRYEEAARYAALARQMMTYHAGMARSSDNRIAELLGLRDVMMADNLAYVADRERGRGKVLAFAHNHHLKYGRAEWQLGPQLVAWWPAGAQIRQVLGSRYAVIGVGVGVSKANGIGEPEPGTLEACLAKAPGPGRFVPTHQDVGLPASELAGMPTRSRGTNPGYFPLTPQSVCEFDWLAMVDSVDKR
jgi:erythromycin esterase